MGRWYARPVFFVADVGRAVDFYLGSLGFEESWRYADPGAQVVQVARGEAEIIFSNQWPAKNGTGMLYVELTAEGFTALRDALSSSGTAFREAWWGSPVLVVADPDGNELFFPDPTAPRDPPAVA